MRRRRALPLAAAAAVLALPATLLTAGSAQAAEPADKAAVLSSWTQTSSSSYSKWLNARNNQAAWSAYGFTWSTDYCSSSPDNPFGFPFQLSCARHDFGYRNYKAAGTFSANKARLDSAFYADLKRVCSRYSGVKRTSCDSTAWIYYQAVDKFGSVAPAGVVAG
ncbi:phospholipase [Streptomyces sp. TRM64462]|uniref:phospholipase n=1 Tax=Streptomyces sp. TRM64462 TaxID=2741726 RepID=UPI001586A2A1|nr:phospholipase [Streptomyces sp. TRM64462]